MDFLASRLLQLDQVVLACELYTHVLIGSDVSKCSLVLEQHIRAWTALNDTIEALPPMQSRLPTRAMMDLSPDRNPYKTG